MYSQGDAPFTYDITQFTEVSNENTYAFLVEDRILAFSTRIALIDEAKHSIDISYYTIHNGTSKNIFFGALINAANRGVKIRLIVDGLSNSKIFGNEEFKVLDLENNIDVKYYEPLNPLKPYAFNNTLHDKIMIIDEQYGLIGGRNISDRMFVEYDDSKKETYDRDVLIYGTKNYHHTVLDMKDYYDELFNHKYSKTKKIIKTEKLDNIKTRLLNAYYDYIKIANLNEVKEYIFDNAIKVENTTFIRSPITRLNKYPVVFSTISELSKNYDDIFIQSPYFIVNNQMRKMLPNYDNKRITILTNNIDTNPNLFATSGYIRNRKKLASIATVYEFQSDSSLHAKTIILGDEISIIGSENFDPRSTFLSTESMMVIYSKDFTNHLKDEIDYYLNQSLIVEADGSYIESDTVQPADKKRIKRTILYIISGITFFHDELL